MHRNHMTHCLVGVAAGVLLLVAFGVNVGNLVVLAAVLACPLMMLFMMRAMAADHGGRSGSDDQDRSDERQHTS